MTRCRRTRRRVAVAAAAARNDDDNVDDKNDDDNDDDDEHAADIREYAGENRARSLGGGDGVNVEARSRAHEKS